MINQSFTLGLDEATLTLIHVYRIILYTVIESNNADISMNSFFIERNDSRLEFRTLHYDKWNSNTVLLY